MFIHYTIIIGLLSALALLGVTFLMLQKSRKRFQSMRDSLQENEDRTNTIMSAVSVCVVIIDEETHIILDANNQAIELIGTAKEQIIGKMCYNSICPPNTIQCPVSDPCLPADRYEQELLTADGRLIPILKTVTRKMLGGRNCLIDSFIDISDRKAAETAIYEREEMLRVMTSSVKDAFLMMSSNGAISFFNEAAERMFGWKSEEAINKDLHTLLAPSRYHSAHKKGMEQFKRTGEGGAIGKSLELMALRRDGTEFPIEILLSSVYFHDEWFAVGIIQDITERGRANDALTLGVQRSNSLISLNKNIDSSAKELIAIVIKDAIRLTGSTIGYFAILNEDESVLTINYWSKSAHASSEIIDQPIVYPIETTGLWDEAVRQRRPIMTNNCEGQNPFKNDISEGHDPIVRHMNIPVFEGSHIVAVAGVGNKPTNYDDGDVRQLQLLMQGWWQIMNRRSAEEAFRGSEEKFKQMVDNMELGVTLIGAGMRVLEMNRRMRQWFTDADEQDSINFHPYFTRPANYDSQKSYPTCLTLVDGSVHEGVVTLKCNDAIRIMKVIASPIHDKGISKNKNPLFIGKMHTLRLIIWAYLTHMEHRSWRITLKTNGMPHFS